MIDSLHRMEIDRCVCALCVYDIIYIIHRERQRERKDKKLDSFCARASA